MATKNIVPNADSEGGIGTSSKYWATGFIDAITTTGNLVIGGSIDLEGAIDVNGTTNLNIVDIDGAVNMATTALVTGVLTTTATQVANGGITSGGNIISDTDSTDNLGSTSVRWANLFVDGITATDQITATGFTGTLDGILGSGTAAAATVTTLNTSGNIVTAAAVARVTIQDNADSASGGTLAIQNTDTGVNNHEGGRLYFYANDSSNNVIETGLITSIFTNVSPTAKGSALRLSTYGSNGQVHSLTLAGTGIQVVDSGKIGCASDTDLLTLAADTLTVAGKIKAISNTTSAHPAIVSLGIAANGTGGGNRGFNASFSNATTSSFTGTDSTDQGYGYFAATIVSGRNYTILFKSIVSNGTLGTIITSNGLNFADSTNGAVQSLTLPPAAVYNTVTFTASANATHLGFAGYPTGGTMSLAISDVVLFEGIADVNVGMLTANSTLLGNPTFSGDTTIALGNLVIGTAGKGINFGAYNDSRTSNTSSSAKILDDYEEGTWTPAISDLTLTVAYAKYVKVGSLIHISAVLQYSNGNGSGANITGLPFAAHGTHRSGVDFGNIQGISFGSNATSPMGFIGGTSISCFGFKNNSGYVTADFSTFGSGDFLEFSGTYNTLSG